MFLERRGEEGRQKTTDRIMVGYDLKNAYAQISYMGAGMEEPETAALITGTEVYNIPAVLCKRNRVNQWYFGRDALKEAQENNGTLVKDLVYHALRGESIEVEEESYEALALLTLFVRRSLSLLGLVASPERIDSLMFTVEDLNDDMVRVLGEVSANLGLKNTTVYFQSHMESLYHFAFHQPRELWAQNIYVCDYDGVRMQHYMMERNLRTKPTVVLISQTLTENLVLPENPEEIRQEYLKQRLDDQFLHILQEQIAGKAVTAAYLLGDGFRERWMEKSLQYLCKNRRGFLGNNLFSKGACFSLMDKKELPEVMKQHVYLGPDKLKANLGMHALRNGMDTYYALLDAGVNWYEIKREVCFYAPADGQLEIVITPLDGKNTEVKKVVLNDLPNRPDAMTMVQMNLRMKTADILHIEVLDCGFGDIYPATEQTWEFDMRF